MFDVRVDSRSRAQAFSSQVSSIASQSLSVIFHKMQKACMHRQRSARGQGPTSPRGIHDGLRDSIARRAGVRPLNVPA